MRARCPLLLDREDAAHDHPPPSDSLTTDYYQELGLDQDAPVSEIQDRLTVLEAQNRSRAVFKNAQGESARRSLAWIAEARQVFATEDSKDEYDIRLRRRPVQVEAARIDWTGRAWNYYHVGDYGAARIAARKAREAAPSDPRPWVVSAWIELAENNNKQAKAYADEALIADEDKSAVVDVQEVRGVAFEVLDNHDRAISCYRQALKYAPDTYKGQLYLRLARVLNSDESFDACLEAYSLANNLGSDTREQINQIVRHEVTNSSSGRLKNLEGKVNARDFLAADRGMLLSIIASCMRARKLEAQRDELNRLADRLKDQPKPYRNNSFINDISDLSVLSMPFAIIALFIVFWVGGSLPSVLRTLLWTFFVINTLLLAWCIYSNLEYRSRKKAYERDQERSRIIREQASAASEEAWKIIRSIRG